MRAWDMIKVSLELSWKKKVLTNNDIRKISLLGRKNLLLYEFIYQFSFNA